MKLLSLVAVFILLSSPTTHAVKLTMMGNQGVTISSENDVVIIDAVYEHYTFWEGFSYDKSLFDSEKLNTFTDKNIVFAATHVHRDHFHPQLLGKDLDTNEAITFVGGQQTIESIKEDFINEHRIRARLKCLAATGCDSSFKLSEKTSVQGISTVHNHESYGWLENISMLVSAGDKQVLHLGDAALSIENIATLKSAIRKPNAVLIPYWFLMNRDLLQRFIQALNPELVVVTHFPQAQFKQLQAFLRPIAESLKGEFPDLKFAVPMPGDSLNI